MLQLSMDNLAFNFEEQKSKIIKLRKYTSQLSILFAEDYEELHKSIARILHSLFQEVDSAYDGVEALALYKKNSYDFVLSDISMPNMDGVLLSQHIKTMNPLQEIIILSAYREAHYLHELINIGVRRFIQKPISLEIFLDELYIICKNLYNEQDIKNSISINGDTIFKLNEKDLYVNNRLIELTEYEKRLIYILVQKINQTVSVDEIVNHFYMDNIDIDIENVRKYIYKLRKKIPNELIKNLHGVGYKIVSDT